MFFNTLSYLSLFFTGILSGMLASLFGLGGGLTIVPALLIMLPFFDVNSSITTHTAIGTSLSIMIINSVNSVRIHHRSGNINWNLFGTIIPYITIGTLIGSIVSSWLSAQMLLIVFVLYLVSIIVRLGKKMTLTIYQIKTTVNQKINTIPFVQKLIYGIFTGVVASCIGGGSSLIMVPFLSKYGLLLRQSAAIASAFNMLIAILGTVSYALLNNHKLSLPKYTTGFIFWPAFIWIVFGSLFGVPIGASLSNKLSDKTSNYLYFLLLVVILITMICKIFSYPA